MSTIEPRTLSVRSVPVTVRTAVEADAQASLAFLITAAQETAFLAREASEIQATPDEQAEIIRKRLTSACDLLIVAERDAQIIGSASLIGSSLARSRHWATLGMGVLREYWGQGVGTALVQALFDWASAHGVVRIALEVVETNTRAIHFYEQLGFEHEGRLHARGRLGDTYVDHLAMARVSVS